MVATMSSEERDASSTDRSDPDRRSCRPERRVDIDVDCVVDEVVETGTSEDADLRTELGSSLVGRNSHASQSDDDDELDDVDDVVVVDDDVDDDVDPESFEEDELESFEEDPLSAPFEELDVSEVLPGGVLACEPRLSVLKNPDPLKVTPTG